MTGVPFTIFEQLKDQVQKDQKYLSNLNDPLTGCGRHALAQAAKEANDVSNYSQSFWCYSSEERLCNYVTVVRRDCVIMSQ